MRLCKLNLHKWIKGNRCRSIGTRRDIRICKLCKKKQEYYKNKWNDKPFDTQKYMDIWDAPIE